MKLHSMTLLGEDIVCMLSEYTVCMLSQHTACMLVVDNTLLQDSMQTLNNPLHMRLHPCMPACLSLHCSWYHTLS